MARIKRWCTLALALVFSAALVLPVQAAAPFASVYLDADTLDFPSQTLHVELYRRDESRVFQPDDAVRYACQINRIAGDGDFCIQPMEDDVWVTVDYLTDLDLDGIYELPDDPDNPVYDSMSSSGRLSSWSSYGKRTLSAGQTYRLSAETLVQRGKTVLRERAAGTGSVDLGFSTQSVPNHEHILYLITLRHVDKETGQEQDVCYYLKLYDSVIVPSDVPSTASYYDAVKYAIEQGFLTGTGDDTFSPDWALTRSQLGQILWRFEQSPSAQDGGFSDVAPGDWFHASASWCKQSGLMSGVSPTRFGPDVTLSREQLALILLQYTRYVGRSISGSDDLSGYSDAASVSQWAREGMEWAVGNQLMGDGQTLNPASGVTRAELSVILHAYCKSILNR